MSSGFPVVLTADRTLMANHRLLFDGMLAASQTTAVAPFLLALLLMPRAKHYQERAAVAPLGLRRIEAALRMNGFDASDVAVVPPRQLRRAIGSATRVVAISTGDPCGGGMNSTTMTAIAGGRIYPEALFHRLVGHTRGLIAKTAPSARLLVGGPGAWQLVQDPDTQKAMGIDHVVTGYAEGNAAEIVRALITGKNVPGVIEGHGVSAVKIPPIRGASTMGAVEISRGCGWGCDFCTIAPVPMEHLPEETILADVRTNVASGQNNIAVLSEDFFRFGGGGGHANPPSLINLLKRLRAVEGVRLIQADHANIVSIARFSDDDLKTVRDLLVGDTGARFPWVNVGVETPSGGLLERHGGGPKMGDGLPSEWAGFCAIQVQRLCQAGFLPMVSLLIGLPGEQEDDVRAALRWVESFNEKPVAIFPLLHAPVDGRRGIGRHDLTRLHWRLIEACYRLNFHWIPRMYRDNQQAAGSSSTRRMLMQLLGHGQVLQWKMLFRWRSGKVNR